MDVLGTRPRSSGAWPAFYADLPFTSARPPRHIQLDGAVLPELSVRLVTPLAGPGDSTIAAAAATRVRQLLSGGLVMKGDGNEQRLQPHDVAVITPHVEQASAIAARLADLPGVLIGTANQTQGLEREAVVVIYPLAGYREASAFSIDPGRSSCMATRLLPSTAVDGPHPVEIQTKRC